MSETSDPNSEPAKPESPNPDAGSEVHRTAGSKVDESGASESLRTGVSGEQVDSKTKKAPPDAKPPEAPVKKKRIRTWSRRLVLTFMILITAVLVFQIVLSLLLPWTLRRVAKIYDLDFTCGRPDLSLFSSDAGLWHVNVAQHGEPVANVDYCRADISILNLFRGRLVVQRLEADGVNLTVQRNSDGGIPLLKGLLLAGPQPGAAPAPAKTPGAKPGQIDLRPPVAIDALRLTHVKTHLIDKAVSPELDTEVQMNLRLSDLASPERPAKFSMELLPSAKISPLLDSVVIEAENKKINDNKSLEATFHASAFGLHPKLLEGYLAPLGLHVIADGLTLHGDGTIAIGVIPTNPNAVAGTIDLTDLAVSADAQDAATLKSLSIAIDSIGAGSASIAKIMIQNGSFRGERTKSGALRVAGVEQVSGATSRKPTTQPSPASTILWSVAQITIKDFEASFKDAAVTPAADLKFVVNELTLANIVSDPANPNAAATLTGDFSAPDLIHSIKVNGSCLPFAEKKTLEVKVNAGGIKPDALKPYLSPFGIESELKSATFTCQLNADVSLPADDSIAANARLTKIKLMDGDELLSMDNIHLGGIGIGPGKVRVDTIDIVGPRVAARREKNGVLWAAGIRLNPPKPEPKHDGGKPVHEPTSKPATQPSAAAMLASLPTIDIGSLKWNGVKVQLTDNDAPQDQSSSLAVDDAGVELSGLHIDFDPKAPPAPPAKFHAFLRAPGLAGDIDLNGTLTQTTGGLAADLQLSGESLSATLAAPYLKALNIEPTLKDGSIHAGLHVDVAQTTSGIAANVSATDFHLADATGELLGADKASIAGINLAPSLLEVGDVTLEKPRGHFTREENGALDLVGFRLLPTPRAPKQKSVFAAASTTPVTQPAVATTQVAQTQPSAPPDVLTLGKFSIHDGAFVIVDRVVKPAAELTAKVNGNLQALTWGKAADPSKFLFTLNVDGVVDEAKIEGTATVTPDSAATKLAISATGLKAGSLAAYLPPGMTIELKDGRFRTNLDAGLKTDEKRSVSGHLLVSGLDYRDGAGGSALFSLESFKVSASRVDIPAGVVTVDEISTAGVETRVRLGKDGTLHALGIAIAAAPTTQPAAPATQPVAVAVSPTAAASDAKAASDVITPTTGPLVAVRRKHPLVTVSKFDLNLRRLTIVDESRPGDLPPIVVSDLRVFTPQPIVALGDGAANRPATDMTISLKLENIIDSLVVKTSIAPFAGEPTLTADVTAAGIHGSGMQAQVPELNALIDAAPLTDGQFHAHFFTRAKIDRFDPLEIDLTRAFDAEVDLKAVEFRAVDKGPVLAGVEEIRCDKVHVHPITRQVFMNTVEVNNLVGSATRENDGIHAIGIVIKVPQAPATQPSTPATKPTTVPGPSPATAPSLAADTAPPSGDAGEIKINRLLVSGLDFRVEDKTVSPSLLIPLNQLDLDVRNLSSKEFTDDRPKTKFSLLVGAGKVPLLKKEGGSKPAGPAVAKKPSLAPGMEERDLFSQVQADGELLFYPQPSGWIKASVSSFDLASISSTAKQFKVDLANGVFDTAIEARLPGDGSMKTSSHFIFTDLDLSEPPDGPIRKGLNFPAPTNIVIGALEDADGSIDAPINLQIVRGKLNTSEVIGQAIGAFGAIVTKAIASAPLKTANVVGNVAGAIIPGFGGEKKARQDEPVTITFAPGDDALPPSGLAQLADLLRRLKENPNFEATLRSELSGGPQATSGIIDLMTGDISRAQTRANPSQEDCRELINRLSRRKDDLLRRRQDLLGHARGDVASLDPADAAVSIDHLRAVERDLAATEDALDHLYELERPGAARQAPRRTRQAALAIARARQELIVAILSSSGLTGANDRIHTTRPQFNPSTDTGGGKVVITITVKKKT